MERFLGVFDIVSGEVIVSDPCYDKKIWCSGKLKNVKIGKWDGINNIHAIESIFTKIHGYDERVCELIAIHQDYSNATINWISTDIHVGVDSGQAGIYDFKYYKDDNIFDGKKAIYNECNSLTKDTKLSIEYEQENILKYKKELNNKSEDEKKTINNLIKNRKTLIKYYKTKLGKVRVYESDYDYGSPPTWYSHNCACTSNTLTPPNYHIGTYYDEVEIIDLKGGVIPYGVVSQTGWGDGGYNCFIAKNVNGEIIGIKIIFIKDSEYNN